MFVRWGTTILALTSAILVTASAAAQEPLDPAKVDPTLKGLMFGSTKEQLVSFLKLRSANRYDSLIRGTLDVRDRDRFAREKADAVGAVGNDWVAFEGTKTGWDASIIRGEFAHNTGEEMLHVKEGDTNLYFFFTKGSFYKLSRTGAARSVADMMTDLGRLYGAATTLKYQDEKTKTLVKSALWKTGLLRLALEDRTRMYQVALVTWVLASADDAVRAEWARVKGGPQGINPLVNQAKSIPTEEADPVDDMIGASPKPAPQPAHRKVKK